MQCIHSAIFIVLAIPSVCPSIAGTVSKRMDVRHTFRRSGTDRGIIVVFWTPLPLQNSWEVKYTGLEIVLQISLFISETVRHTHVVIYCGTLIGSHR